jgi:hypothetical protein
MTSIRNPDLLIAADGLKQILARSLVGDIDAAHALAGAIAGCGLVKAVAADFGERMARTPAKIDA